MVFASLTVLIVGYLIGCILGSSIVYVLTGVNLKHTGSKNAGATNAVISVGWKYGIFVVIVDIGKSIFTILLIQNILNQLLFTQEEIVILLYLTGAAVIIGHNFPFHMNFHGGKGTASLIGMLMSINWKIGLFAVISFFVFAFISNYLIVGVFQLYILLAILAFNEESIWPVIISIGLFIIAIILHMENIHRIRNGEELKMSLVYKHR